MNTISYFNNDTFLSTNEFPNDLKSFLSSFEYLKLIKASHVIINSDGDRKRLNVSSSITELAEAYLDVKYKNRSLVSNNTKIIDYKPTRFCSSASSFGIQESKSKVGSSINLTV